MGQIFCLMGKSASGKDTIYKRLLESQKQELIRVIPYTTRPIRSGETDGESYRFCTEEEAAALEAAGKIIELRAYDTVYGVWKYFTADDGQIRLEQGRDYLMIGTLEAYVNLQRFFGAKRVCPVYVWVDDGIRLERALARERTQENPKYAELCRRFLADEQDFAEEKLKKHAIRVRFENRDLEQCIRQIEDYIRMEKAVARWQDLET